MKRTRNQKKLIPHPLGKRSRPSYNHGYSSIKELLGYWDWYLDDNPCLEENQNWLTTLLRAQRSPKLKREIKEALEDVLEHHREKRLKRAIREINSNFDLLKKTIEKER